MEKTALDNAKNVGKTARVYVYLGPSIKGVVNNGKIFKGTKEEIMSGIRANAEAQGVLAKCKKIPRLLVVDTEVAHISELLAAKNNGASEAYAAIENA